MNHDPFQWGRPRDDVYGTYNQSIAKCSNSVEFPSMHTQQPIITGTSVLGLKFKNGIVIAADHMGSYGSLLRFNNIERLIRVGSETVVGISGDISDLQHIERLLHQLETEEEVYDNTGAKLRAPHIHEYLTRVLYNRRLKMDPLWNAVIVAGFNDDRSPFIRYVDLLGVAYGALALATGFGAHLAIPLLRQLVPYDEDYVKVTEEEAREAIVNSMRVLYYRDARASDKYTLATLSFEDGKVQVKFAEDMQVENQSWKFAEKVIGYGSKQL